MSLFYLILRGEILAEVDFYDELRSLLFNITQTKTTSRGSLPQSDGPLAKFTMARKKVIVFASHLTCLWTFIKISNA